MCWILGIEARDSMRVFVEPITVLEDNWIGFAVACSCLGRFFQRPVGMLFVDGIFKISTMWWKLRQQGHLRSGSSMSFEYISTVLVIF